LLPATILAARRLTKCAPLQIVLEKRWQP